LYKLYLQCKECFNHIITIRFLKTEQVLLLYINDINIVAYRLWNFVNNSLSLAIGFKHGILCSLKMVHLYQNMSELHL